MNFYIADLHFGHKGAILYDHRPFADVHEMDGVLIALWNGRVQKDDDIYVVGDFCYRSDKEPSWYLRQLKGRKHLILGNHDGKLENDEKAMSYFESVDKMKFVEDKKERICLCHYPIAEWDGFFKGSWHVYGHIHNKKDETYQFMSTREKALNAGCMINNFTPASFRELVENNEQFKKKENNKLGEPLEEGNIIYEMSEYTKTGLIYKYHVDGRADHEHMFDGVLENAYLHYDSFVIPNEFKDLYSQQELKMIEAVLDKRRKEK